MIVAKIPDSEPERLKELYKYELLDTVYEREFDEIVSLASKICNVPISLITLVDMNRQWFKAKKGLEITETTRDISFCSHAILDDKMFEVKDAALDERFFDNPLVQEEPKIRYYGGMPLITTSGFRIGTLCVIDRIPRELDEEQTFALKVLSSQVMTMFELRARNKELSKVMDVLHRSMAIMAHDIRGPLSSLKSVIDFKNEGFFSEEEAQELDKLLPNQLDNTLRLLNNIVDWTKLQITNAASDSGSFYIESLVDEIIAYAALQARAKNIRILNNVPEELTCNANKDGIEFVLRNLISNAMKFTENGTISIDASADKMGCLLTVSDTGKGMPTDIIESISKRTWSNKTSGTHNEKGSGMGLKLIYEYLTNLGGTITFSNNEHGTGTVVKVMLPNPNA